MANGGTTYASSGERALDTSIATPINPNSKLILYVGSGNQTGAKSESLTARQSAVWDTVNSPQVISSSVRFAAAQPAPGSPFLYAADQVFEDAAMRNITVVTSSGDGGSGYQTPNGLPKVSSGRGSQYNLLVAARRSAPGRGRRSTRRCAISSWRCGRLRTIDPFSLTLEMGARLEDLAGTIHAHRRSARLSMRQACGRWGRRCIFEEDVTAHDVTAVSLIIIKDPLRGRRAPPFPFLSGRCRDRSCWPRDR